MTPKEKAKELVDKFIGFGKRLAKQCALIAVYEIIEGVSLVNWQEVENIDFAPFFDYWEEVKTEIEKL